LTLTAIVLPIALLGTIYLQKTRNVSFFDKQDNSITWRQTVWNEGFDLATQNLRHLTVGVGMDSIKRYAKDWRLFDDGKLPTGHFHSTPLQLVIERGLPSLLLWLLILGVYCKELISNIKRQTSNIYKGILLGCLGGTFGFFISGIVHYNLGDAEVAMVFFLLMGIGLSVKKLSESHNAQV
jgi:O-antigen ligase